MGPITSIFPVARAVTLAGQPFKVAEFTLRDLAFLQSILDDAEPDPLEAFEAGSAGMRPRARHAALVAAYDRADRGPALYGKTSGNDYFSTAEGAALFLWAALRRANDVGPQEAARLFLECTGPEFGRVWRIAHGVTARGALERILVGPLPPSGGGGREKSWAEMIDEVSRERGWTYQQIYDLTITEWIAARNGGKLPGDDQVLAVSIEEACRIRAEQERRLRGEYITDPDDGADGAAPNPPAG